MKFTILKIPFEAGNPTGAKGPALAPDLICKELGIDGEEVKVSSDFEETNRNIINAANGKRPLSIGGDHSITYALVKATKPEALLYFDAHLDCEDDFLPPSHEDVIRAIINENLIKPEDIIIIGARRFFTKELAFLKKHNIKCIRKPNVSELQNIISKFKRIYCSIDIDVFDPSIAPGTNYRESDGLNYHEVSSILETIAPEQIVGVDITEVSPKQDINNKTIKLAARIAKRFL